MNLCRLVDDNNEVTMRLLMALMMITLLLTGCGWRKKNADHLADREVSIYVAEEVAYTLERMVAEYNFLNFDLHICHSKAYKTPEGDLRVWVDLYSQELLEVKDARHLMANLVAAIVQGLNKHYYIKTEHGNSEISVRNLYLNVQFDSFFGRFVDPLYVGRMELINGYLTAYYAHTALDRDSIIFHQFFEPYVTSAMLTRVDTRVLEEMSELSPKKDLGEFLDSAQEFHKNTMLNKEPTKEPPPPFYREQVDH